MSEEREAGAIRDAGGPLSARLMAVLALAAGAGGVQLVRGGGTGDISGGVLLLVAALALAGIALGGSRYGPEVEGSLDLSARLGVGLLGGVLGAAAALLVEWLLSALGVTALYGIVPPSRGPLSELGLRFLGGGVWGMVLGVLLPIVPGGGPVARGAVFSLLPSLWVLLKVFPVDLDVGVFGHELGAAAFLFVLLYNVVWGMVAGRVLAWADGSEEAPLSRPLGA